MRLLSKRKGGGGGGRSGGGGGSRSGEGGGGESTGGRTSSSTSYSGRSTSNGQGGGTRSIIPQGLPFAGRQTGGGVRNDVFGGQRYGSTYDYARGSNPGSYVASRGFAFGFWPIFIFPHPYYGNHEYGPANNSSRPGGNMTQAEVVSTSWQTKQANATSPYFIVGDYDSVNFLGGIIASNCAATIGYPYTVNPDDPSHITPEQIVWYYRDSSFALALTSYNDTANSLINQPASNDSALTTQPDAPIPDGTDLNFLGCLNQTIFNNVPIADAGYHMHAVSFSLLSYLFIFWVVNGSLSCI